MNECSSGNRRFICFRKREWEREKRVKQHASWSLRPLINSLSSAPGPPPWACAITASWLCSTQDILRNKWMADCSSSRQASAGAIKQYKHAALHNSLHCWVWQNKNYGEQSVRAISKPNQSCFELVVKSTRR